MCPGTDEHCSQVVHTPKGIGHNAVPLIIPQNIFTSSCEPNRITMAFHNVAYSFNASALLASVARSISTILWKILHRISLSTVTVAFVYETLLCDLDFFSRSKGRCSQEQMLIVDDTRRASRRVQKQNSLDQCIEDRSLLLRLLLLCWPAGAVRGAKCPRCIVFSVSLFFFFPISPFLPLRFDVESLRPTRSSSRACSAALLAAHQILRLPLALCMLDPSSTMLPSTTSCTCSALRGFHYFSIVFFFFFLFNAFFLRCHLFFSLMPFLGLNFSFFFSFLLSLSLFRMFLSLLLRPLLLSRLLRSLFLSRLLRSLLLFLLRLLRSLLVLRLLRSPLFFFFFPFVLAFLPFALNAGGSSFVISSCSVSLFLFVSSSLSSFVSCALSLSFLRRLLPSHPSGFLLPSLGLTWPGCVSHRPPC